MHDLLCKKKCSCSNVCYSHPEMDNKEHKCYTCLIKDNELIEEDVSYIQGIKNSINNLKIIFIYLSKRILGKGD